MTHVFEALTLQNAVLRDRHLDADDGRVSDT